ARILVRQVNLLDLLQALFLGIGAGMTGGLMLGWRRLRQRLGRKPASGSGATVKGLYPAYAESVSRATDLTPWAAPAAQKWDARQADVEGLALSSAEGSHSPALAEISLLLRRLERKLVEFDEALAEEPRTVDRNRAEHLEGLARYAQQQSARLVELVRAFAAE